MRVSQSMLYSNFISYLNTSTSNLQDLYAQAASQKKLNKPSDNPVGMARVLNYRDSSAALEQYQDNINTAKGWLGLADESLQQVQDIITRVKELTVQASTGTLTEDDRQTILVEVEQNFEQIFALANTSYEGKGIFSGHKTDQEAYKKGLAVLSNKQVTINMADGEAKQEDDVTPYVKSVSGTSSDLIVVEFTSAGSGANSAEIGDSSETINYRYSTDGGQSFTDRSLTAGSTTLDLGGVTLELQKGYTVDLSSSSRTELYLAPTAVYQGDDQNKPGVEMINNFDILAETGNGSFDGDVQVRITNNETIGSGNAVEYQYSLDGGANWSGTLKADNPATLNPATDSLTLYLPGGEVQVKDGGPGTGDLSGLEFVIHGTKVQQLNTTIHAFAQGDFSINVLVRIDDADPSTSTLDTVNLGSGNKIYYSYSLDGGTTWVSGNYSDNTTASARYAELVVPGGILKLAPTSTATTLTPGDQFLIKPRNADINLEISEGVNLQVNNLGPDVFGGYYENSNGLEPAFEEDEEKNLFLNLSRLMVALQTNDQSALQEQLDRLDASMQQVANCQASVGARENRLDTTDKVLSALSVNNEERRSKIEDVDFPSLMSEISQEQTVYQAILKSASMIMQRSLVDYI